MLAGLYWNSSIGVGFTVFSSRLLQQFDEKRSSKTSKPEVGASARQVMEKIRIRKTDEEIMRCTLMEASNGPRGSPLYASFEYTMSEIALF
jgi:hypothetical protein